MRPERERDEKKKVAKLAERGSDKQRDEALIIGG
jgi:hypothetical protein